MNGRIERADGMFEIVSEDSYQTVNKVKADARRARLRRRIEGWFAFACFVGYMWLIIWGGVGR